MFYKLLCIDVNHLALFRLNVIKKYQRRALQQVEKSADNDDLFGHEMSTYYRLFDRRNDITSTEIVLSDPT